MELPEVGYQETEQKKRIDGWKGLNLRDEATDGELVGEKNMSSRRYPYLAPRLGRVVEGTYTEPMDLFSWDKLCVVDNGILYYDGQAIDNVTPGKKQFAVVGTKLCVFPDKKYIDLTNNEFKKLEAEVTTNAPAVFTTNTLTATLTPKLQENITLPGFSSSGDIRYTAHPWVNFYGTDPDALSWNESAGWTRPAAVVRDLFTTSSSELMGQIFIPKVDVFGAGVVFCVADSVWQLNAPNSVPIDRENNNGYYAVVVGFDPNSYVGIYGSRVALRADLYRKGYDNPLFSAYFNVGDAVTVSGCSVEGNNVEKRQILAIDDETNTLTFADGTFTAGSANAGMTIQRPVPDLDFVCECNNRLWGVSNADKTIYASSLGEPARFYDYSGLDTDSYAVAVASRGNFTGCISYSGQVLFWKEDLLHRIVGDYPSNYYMYTDSIEGVQAGSDKSMTIINEVLYYKAPNGIYAYTGGQPTLLSYRLGEDVYSAAAAGSDRMDYYISMADGEGKRHLFVLDTVQGIWSEQDDVDAIAFTYFGGSIYMATGEHLYKLDASGSENIEWRAELAATDEGTSAHKQYRWLTLDVELAKGALLQVEVSVDGGRPEPVQRISRAGRQTVRIPLRAARNRYIAMILSGHGEVVVRSIQRTWIACSEEV